MKSERSIAITACLSLAAMAAAQPITINNPGFESTVLAENGFVWGIAGWTVLGAAGTFNPTAGAYAGQAPEGDNVAFLTCCTGPSPSSGSISQILGTNYAADKTYTLTVQSGRRLDETGTLTSYRLTAGYGNAVLKTQAFLTMPAAGSFRTDTLVWDVYSGDTAIGRPILIRLQHGGGPGQINMDDVELVESVLCVRMRTQPTTTAACPGQVASLSARVGGVGPFTFTWQYENPAGVWNNLTSGGPGPGGLSTVTFAVSGGGQTSTLNIIGFTAGDLKNYRLSVATGCGDSAVSDAATFTSCSVDYACDGFIDFNDYLAYILAYEAGESGADFNGDAFVDFFDYSDFLAAFVEGC